MTKTVLVTYLECNKIFTFPSSGDGRSDLTVLEEQFRKEFKFDSNVSLEITFQRLQVDCDWGEIYIDLDHDSTLNHKDKLKAVVTPVLTTSKGSSQVNLKQLCVGFRSARGACANGDHVCLASTQHVLGSLNNAGHRYIAS